MPEVFLHFGTWCGMANHCKYVLLDDSPLRNLRIRVRARWHRSDTGSAQNTGRDADVPEVFLHFGTWCGMANHCKYVLLEEIIYAD